MWGLAAIASLVLAPLLYLACLDGRFRLRRSIEVEVPVEQVFNAVADLASWPQWNPWLLHEADADLVFSENCKAEGGYYSWSGRLVGAGKLTHVEIRPQHSIHQQIELTRPFKALNRVDWEFEGQGNKTLLSWEMSVKMPFLRRFMTKTMEASSARDLELGLAMLGGYLDPSMPHPVPAFAGTEELESFTYWSIPCNGNLRQLEASRRSSIDALRANAAARIGLSFTLYHRFDPYASQFQAEIAVPVSDHPPASNYRLRRFDGGHYIKMTLQGDLAFVPLGWHLLASHCRMQKLKPEPRRPALEIYSDDPGATEDAQQGSTTLYLPVKSR